MIVSAPTWVRPDVGRIRIIIRVPIIPAVTVRKPNMKKIGFQLGFIEITPRQHITNIGNITRTSNVMITYMVMITKPNTLVPPFNLCSGVVPGE